MHSSGLPTELDALGWSPGICAVEVHGVILIQQQ